MTVRIGVNGMGRIGRAVLRGVAARAGSGVEVVAVNDVTPVSTLAHLLRYDSVHGRWPGVEGRDDSHILVRGAPVRVFGCADPADIDWAGDGVELVVEATGRFRTRDEAARHLGGGVRKVVLTAPGRDVDLTVVMGLNEHRYSPERHHVVSNASCTTNCAAPMVHVLHQAFGIDRGLLTTVHAYTPDQNLQDGPHKDLRRARAAATNMIPTSTGAARAVESVVPGLEGRLDGVAVRVPVADVSLVDLVVRLVTPATAEQVNGAFRAAAQGELKGYLTCTEDPIVSSDVLGDPASCVFDPGLTRCTADLVKVFGWYDNEWGYAQRTVDLVEMVAGTLG